LAHYLEIYRGDITSELEYGRDTFLKIYLKHLKVHTASQPGRGGVSKLFDMRATYDFA
jgi:hypothetical protein